MPDAVTYGLVGLIVCFTAFQEGVTGFGATVLALPFVTLLLGLPTAVPALVMQSGILSLLIVLESRKYIVWREYGHIALLVGLGLPIGIWMRQAIPEYYLKWILAGFMIVVGTQGLIRLLLGKPHSKMSTGKKVFTSSFLPLGGIIHGAFGTGGPLVVIYATRALTDKTLFRVTMCMMWLTMNTILTAQFLLGKGPHLHVVKIVGICLPFTLLGLFIGNKAHYRINEQAFRKAVYCVLIAMGAVLVCDLVGLI